MSLWGGGSYKCSRNMFYFYYFDLYPYMVQEQAFAKFYQIKYRKFLEPQDLTYDSKYFLEQSSLRNMKDYYDFMTRKPLPRTGYGLSDSFLMRYTPTTGPTFAKVIRTESGYMKPDGMPEFPFYITENQDGLVYDIKNLGIVKKYFYTVVQSNDISSGPIVVDSIDLKHNILQCKRLSDKDVVVDKDMNQIWPVVTCKAPVELVKFLTKTREA